MPGRFEVYTDRAQLHRFRLKDERGVVVAVGESFVSADAAKAGCAQVQRAAAGARIEDVDS